MANDYHDVISDGTTVSSVYSIPFCIFFGNGRQNSLTLMTYNHIVIKPETIFLSLYVKEAKKVSANRLKWNGNAMQIRNANVFWYTPFEYTDLLLYS